MGLYAGERSWSYNYGIFQDVRDGLARAVGRVDRHDGLRGQYTPQALMGFWVEEEHFWGLGPNGQREVSDDLDYLLLHQDCLGIFMPYTSAKVAARLKDILARCEFPPIRRRHIVELMDLLEWAGEEDQIVEFA